MASLLSDGNLHSESGCGGAGTDAVSEVCVDGLRAKLQGRV